MSFSSSVAGPASLSRPAVAPIRGLDFPAAVDEAGVLSASGAGQQPGFKVLVVLRAARVERHLNQQCRPSVPDAAAVHSGPAPMGGTS